jgi:hypothetical protein
MTDVDPLERARSAALAGAGFNDPRSGPLLVEVMPLVDDADLAKFVGDLSRLAPELVAQAVSSAMTTPDRRRIVIDICEREGLIDLTARLHDDDGETASPASPSSPASSGGFSS